MNLARRQPEKAAAVPHPGKEPYLYIPGSAAAVARGLWSK